MARHMVRICTLIIAVCLIAACGAPSESPEMTEDELVANCLLYTSDAADE